MILVKPGGERVPRLRRPQFAVIASGASGAILAEHGDCFVAALLAMTRGSGDCFVAALFAMTRGES